MAESNLSVIPSIAFSDDPDEIRRRISHLDGAARKSLESTDALVVEMSASNDKESKRIAKKIVAGAKQAIDVVEGVAELHPIAKATVVVFKVDNIASNELTETNKCFQAIIRLEMDRRENNEQIAIICRSMVLFTFQFLHNYFLILYRHDSSMFLDILTDVIRKGDEITSLFGERLEGVELLIKEFGEFSHVYYRYKSSTFRVCFSGSYKERLKGFSSIFSLKRQDLLYLISARTSVKIHKMYQDVGNIAECADKILSALGENTIREQQDSYNKMVE